MNVLENRGQLAEWRQHPAMPSSSCPSPVACLDLSVAVLQAVGADNPTPTDVEKSRFGMTLLKASSFGPRRESAPPPD
jgi:hypothetical protein